MEYATCISCDMSYNVSSKRDKSKVFVCQDCEEKAKARMKGRRPRLVYRNGMAHVIYEKVSD